MRRAVLVALLAGCGDGPNPETLIDGLRVVAAVSDPPVVAPDAAHAIAFTVADPDDLGVEVLVWVCDDAGCTTARPAVVDETATVELALHSAAPVWALACAPGLCGLDDPDPADLADPPAWAATLPLEDVSFAFRRPRLSIEAVDAANPQVQQAPEVDLADVEAGEAVDLAFVVPGASEAWGYTTAGGFEMPSEDVDADGQVTLRWYAPARRATDARLYVVFEDEAGGGHVWRAGAGPTR